MSNSPHVYSAIAAITGELAQEGISKNHRNTTQGYQFRGIDDVYYALAAKLADHKLCVLPRVLSREMSERKSNNGGTLFYSFLHVEYDFVSAVDASKHTVSTFGEGMDSGDKSTNKAMSAAYKYAALQAFCIPVEGEAIDSEKDSHSVAADEPPMSNPRNKEEREQAKAAAQSVATRKIQEIRQSEAPQYDAEFADKWALVKSKPHAINAINKRVMELGAIIGEAAAAEFANKLYGRLKKSTAEMTDEERKQTCYLLWLEVRRATKEAEKNAVSDTPTWVSEPHLAISESKEGA